MLRECCDCHETKELADFQLIGKCFIKRCKACHKLLLRKNYDKIRVGKKRTFLELKPGLLEQAQKLLDEGTKPYRVSLEMKLSASIIYGAIKKGLIKQKEPKTV